MGQPVTVAIARWEVGADGSLRLLLQTVPLALEAQWWRVRVGAGPSATGWDWRRPPAPPLSAVALDPAAAASLSKLADKPADPETAALLDQLVAAHPVLVKIADQFGLAAPRR